MQCPPSKVNQKEEDWNPYLIGKDKLFQNLLNFVLDGL